MTKLIKFLIKGIKYIAIAIVVVPLLIVMGVFSPSRNNTQKYDHVVSSSREAPSAGVTHNSPDTIKIPPDVLPADRFRQAAERGDAEAEHQIGRSYYWGVGVKKNLKTACAWWEKSSAQGNAIAEYDLANCFLGENGPHKDLQQGVFWLKKSAGQGYADAQDELASVYATGHGVKKDNVQALKLFRLAATQGQPHAETALGFAYNSGDLDLPKNPAKAFSWFRKAANDNSVVGEELVGDAYFSGANVKKDDKEAAKWWQKAAKQGDDYAQSMLRLLSAKQGDVTAQLSLGQDYYYGRGLQKDDKKAFHWWHEAAKQGDPRAEDGLGMLYASGHGVRKSQVSAEAWFRKAARQGNKDAIKRLAAWQAATTSDTDDNFSSFDILLSIILGVPLIVWVDSKRSFNPKVLTDTTRPESARRAELVQMLLRKGYIIQRQEPGIVTVMKQKLPFSMFGFILMSLFFLLPGILYLIYYATRRDEIKQFVLVH